MLDVLSIWKQEAGEDVMSAFQEEVIRHVMRRKDALVVMPGGEDRELCYQVPAMLMRGLVLVISPRCRERMVNGKLFYIRAERLQRAMEWLRDRDVGLFVVDEAQLYGGVAEGLCASLCGFGAVASAFPGRPHFGTDGGIG